jgi:hypothetical protein
MASALKAGAFFIILKSEKQLSFVKQKTIDTFV